MSLFTTEVRFICENYAGYSESQGYKKVNEIVHAAAPEIFDEFNANDEFFDESYRPLLEEKILKHFYTREIGYETVGLWQFKLNQKMSEIMPYYNRLYRSELIDFNPLYTVNTTKVYNKGKNENRNETVNEATTENIRETEDRTGTKNKQENENENENIAGVKNAAENRSGTQSESGLTNETGSGNKSFLENNSENSEKTGETSSTGNEIGNSTESDIKNNVNRDRFSDTPQGSLSGVESDTYLTTARKITDETTDENTRASSLNKAESGETHENIDTSGDKTGSSEESTVKNSTSSASSENAEEFTSDETEETQRNRGNIKVGSEDHSENTAGTKTSDASRNLNTAGNIHNLEDYFETVTGLNGKSPSKLLLEFRETFINIDMMIIEELNELFMGLWA